MNGLLWAREDLVGRYANRTLRPPEATILLRYRDALQGRVLELGAGAGRVTGYLDEVAEQVVALDVSSHMLAALAERYPRVEPMQRDMRELSDLAAGSFDAVVCAFNGLGVLDDPDRRTLLGQVNRILKPDGLLVFSTHNLAAADRITDPMKPHKQLRHPSEAAAAVLFSLRWARNRRRLLPYERREAGYAILNDISHDFSSLNYYVTRDAQERQLADHGLGLLECLDLEGEPVPAGQTAPASAELHYVARRT